jgi:Uma2 family endonuclease
MGQQHQLDILHADMPWPLANNYAEQMPDARAWLSDEPEMESSLHYEQIALLVSCLEWYWRERQDFFIGANLTVYYSMQQLRHRDFRGPDFFLVKETEHRPRNSWVVWEENGRYPDLIIEMLSDATASVDRNEKKDIYQRVFRSPEYFWFSPDTLEFAGFRLVNNKYRAIRPNARHHLWSSVLGLYLGVEPNTSKLRYFDGSGRLVPTAQESALMEQNRAEQAYARAEQERARADQAHDRAEQLAQRLRELGVEP